MRVIENNHEYIEIDRDTAISHLVNSMFDAMAQDDYYMASVIENGFKGFINYTDEELLQEYRDYISEDPTYLITIKFTEKTI